MTDYARLPTEKPNPRSRDLDLLTPLQLVRLMNREDARVIAAARRASPDIARAAALVAEALGRGGRLFLAGAGTSGRLCILEAAECPPTFNTPRDLIQFFMAGGASSVFRSKEGAEDRGDDARRLVRAKVKKGDVVAGVAASGVTAFARAAVQEARRRGARTILITCNADPSVRRLADVAVVLHTGPEVLSGSTRLKAGTATKMALNMITTAAMARLGKVYGNWMVDLQPRSKKLVARGLRLIRTLGNVDEAEAARLFRRAKGHVKTAVLMARRDMTEPAARRALAAAGGSLRKALG